MSNTTAQKFCFYGCTCNKEGCTNIHKIKDAEDRKLFYENVFVPFYKPNQTAYRETDPTGCRRRACEFSLFCNRKGCGFKHDCNEEGRQVLTKEWRKLEKQLKVKVLFEKMEKLGEGQEDLLSTIESLKKLVIFNPSVSKSEKEGVLESDVSE